MVLLALAIFRLGEQRPLDAGWTALEIAVAGMVLAGWWNYGLTGRSSDRPRGVPGCPGHPACWPSPRAPWRSSSRPASWGELLLLSQTVAAVTALLYHSANAHQITSTGKHLDGEGRGDDRRHSLRLRQPGAPGTGRSCCDSWATAPPRAWSRRTPPWWNSWDACSSSSASTRSVAAGAGPGDRGQAARVSRGPSGDAGRRDRRGRGPWIAALGSGPAVASWTVAPALAPHRPDHHALPGRAVGRGLPRHRHGHGRDPWPGPVARVDPRASRAGDEARPWCTAACSWGACMPSVRLRRPRSSAGWARRSPCSPPACWRALAFPLLKTIIETFDGSPPFFRRARRNYRDPLLFVRGAVVGAGVGLALILQLPSEDLPSRAWFGFGVGALAYAGIDILRDFLASARDRGRVPATSLLRRARAPGRLHRGSDRVLPRRIAGLRGRRQVPSLPRRGPAARTLRHLSARQQVGPPRLGIGHGGSGSASSRSRWPA